MFHPPNIVRIDLSSVVHNLKQIKDLVAPETKIMGIVKSDAYGHGMVEVARVLEKNGVYALGTAFIHEAMTLRKNGIKVPVIILCGIKSLEDAEAVVENNLTPVIFDLPSAAILAGAAEKKLKKASIQVKIDTGMGRLGVSYDEAMLFMNEIMQFAWLNTEGLMSHLSSADEEDRDFTNTQIERFDKVIGAARAMGMDLRLNNLANSAGLMAYNGSHFDMVRPGIMLYGGLPSPGFNASVQLKPVMDFRGKILQIRHMPDNTPVSYGRKYYTAGIKKLAVVSAGYGDGIPRGLSNKGKIIIRGKKINIVGTICMNMLLADITGVKDAEPGDEVVFLGTQGTERITGDEIAAWNNTISYEIFLSIGKGVDRVYTGR
jgi:alanine racemase